jgi:hypothetical protein
VFHSMGLLFWEILPIPREGKRARMSKNDGVIVLHGIQPQLAIRTRIWHTMAHCLSFPFARSPGWITRQSLITGVHRQSLAWV